MAAGTTSTTIANDAITDVKVAAAAGIARSKFANGTNNAVVVNNGTGVMSDLFCANTQVIKWVAGVPTCAADANSGGDVTNNGNSFAGAMTIGTNDNNILNFETNGSNKMTILANGDVGIGTTAPGDLLHISKSQSAATTIRVENTSNNTAASSGIGVYNDVGSLGGISAPSSTYLLPQFASRLWLAASNNASGIDLTALGGAADIRFYTGGFATTNERLRITSTGNLGIGTSTPNRLLEVAGPVRISPTALPGAPAAGDIAIDSGASNSLKYHNGSGWQTIGTGTVNGTGTTNKISKFSAAGTIADSNLTDDGSRITASRSIAAVTNTVAAAAVNLNLSNTHTLNTVGGAAITITNPSNGGVYNIIVTDATSRTYTFSGCTASYYRPANAPTTAATRTIYGLMTVDNGAGGWDCYITWSSGFQ